MELSQCLAAAGALALQEFKRLEQFKLAIAAGAAALLLALLIAKLLGQHVSSITVEPISGALRALAGLAPHCMQCSRWSGPQYARRSELGGAAAAAAAAASGAAAATRLRRLALVGAAAGTWGRAAADDPQQRCPALACRAGEAAPGSPTRRSPRKAGQPPAGQIPCTDPGTGELLGYVPAMTAAEVCVCVCGGAGGRRM